jgi:septum formation inhibitor-activating ATPase MinD
MTAVMTAVMTVMIGVVAVGMTTVAAIELINLAPTSKRNAMVAFDVLPCRILNVIFCCAATPVF